MKKIITVFLCFLTFHLSGQNMSANGNNPRIEKRSGINASLGGPGVYASISYDHFIKPTINFEIGVGPATLFGGINYHFGGDKDKNWTPYVGGYGVYIWLFDVFDDDDNETPFGAYVPVGIRYMGDGGFTFGLEAAAFVGVGGVLPFGRLNFGYHF